MMGRKKFVGALVVGAMGAAPAMADGFSERIVQQLEQQGFRGISTERTWLGRTRIIAEGSDGQREIIVNPNTGEILRDLMMTSKAGGGGNGGLVNVSERAGSGGGSSDASAGVVSTTVSGETRNGGKSRDGNGDKSRDRDRERDRSGDRDSNKGSGGSGGSSGGSNGGNSD